jgi:hypothetical protein
MTTSCTSLEFGCEAGLVLWVPRRDLYGTYNSGRFFLKISFLVVFGMRNCFFDLVWGSIGDLTCSEIVLFVYHCILECNDVMHRIMIFGSEG